MLLCFAFFVSFYPYSIFIFYSFTPPVYASMQDIVVRATTANIIDVDSSTVDGEYGTGQDIYINVTFG